MVENIPKFLNYQLISIKVPQEIFKEVIDFYFKLDFMISFEDIEIQISEFRIHQGLYLRVTGEEISKQHYQNVIFSISVPDINESYTYFSKKTKQITEIKSLKEMESYFELRDPSGFKIRICEFQHGPVEWRESLDSYLKSKRKI